MRDVAAHVEAVKGSGGSMQDLSMIFLLALLGFVTLAGANTLAMLSGQRGGELALLRRTGATGRQLTAMVLVEAVVALGTTVPITLRRRAVS